MSIGSQVARVRKRFGHLADDVSHLALRNQRFRSLCDDYGMTIDALDILERRNHSADVEKMVEYRALRGELERDIEQELLACSNQSDD
jgi:hypothetical protein